MKLLHTADWHLGDRLGRIDRTHDLRRAVERVAQHCQREKVDVLLVAGDLFSELARADSLRESIEHWQSVFGDFLAEGGTILTLTGNHDNENFCQTLHRAMSLAAPLPRKAGALLPHGRVYLAAEPTLLRLADRHTGDEVQFILMPYPTPSRYLRNAEDRRYNSIEEKNRKLHDAFLKTMYDLRQHENFDAKKPVVLGAHANFTEAKSGAGLFRISREDDVLIEPETLSDDFTYVALGHIHKPHTLGGRNNVRYSGSIEKMDLGEAEDAKQVVVFDVGPDGLIGEPRSIAMPSTPIYEVAVFNPSEMLEQMKDQYANCDEDLVNLHITYTAGKENLEEVLRELEKIFPNWYHRDWKETSALRDSLVDPESTRSRSVEETVRDYVTQEMIQHAEGESKEVLDRLDALLRES